MLHDPLLADGAESINWLAPQQRDAADHKGGGAEANPDRRAKMHAVIIWNGADDCKHSRIAFL
jgi:hypothetical protein